MELKLTTVFRPLTRTAGFILSELEVDPTKVALVSFIAALLSSIFFIASFSIPFFSARVVASLAVLLIFINAFLDDVERRIEIRRNKKSLLGGPLGTLLGAYSDIFIIGASVYFLASRDTYYNLGRFFLIDLSFVEPGFYGHLSLGLILLGGLFLLRRVASAKKVKGVGLWSRSERMYLLGFLYGIGLFTGLFSGFVFTGLLALTMLLYLSLYKMVRPKPRYKKKPLIITAVGLIRNILLKVTRNILRLIGALLLGIYVFFEKLFRGLKNIMTAIKKSSSKSRKRTSPEKKYPVVRPFEGTISPSPSGLPASGSQAVQPITMDEEVALNVQTSDEPFIEFPPASHILDEKPSYSGDEGLGESMLVEYEPTSKKDSVLKDIIDFMISEGKNLVIAATQPSASKHREQFKDTQGLRVIELIEQSGIPTKDEIPMTNLEYFSEVFEALGPDDVFIFESLSNLVLEIGVAQAYKFISGAASTLTREKVTFIVFINRLGHDDKDISNFENLFTNIGIVDENKLKKVR